MKSVVLCEGKDDLWFIAYYLNKSSGWETCPSPWRNYTITPQNDRQEVVYLRKALDSVAVWCVGGKDCFAQAISIVFEKFVGDYPFDPINSIVIIRDRDNDTISDVLTTMQRWLPNGLELHNKIATPWTDTIDGNDVTVKITPVIIPFSEAGAIETLLMKSIKEQSSEGEVVVQGANKYINSLVEHPGVASKYLSHDRLVLKARYSAVIAATNPGHSTALFRDMVIACPWETSDYVKEHFGVILSAVTSQ